MKFLRKVHYKDIDLVFVNSYYDHPLGGLCRLDGKICRFYREYGEDHYYVYELSRWETLKALYRKKRFEICVGYHLTYPYRAQGHRFYIRRPKWLFRLLYNYHFFGLKMGKWRKW